MTVAKAKANKTFRAQASLTIVTYNHNNIFIVLPTGLLRLDLDPSHPGHLQDHSRPVPIYSKSPDSPWLQAEQEEEVISDCPSIFFRNWPWLL